MLSLQTFLLFPVLLPYMLQDLICLLLVIIMIITRPGGSLALERAMVSQSMPYKTNVPATQILPLAIV